MKTLLKLTITTLTLITITACNSSNGKGKQNSKHGLINTPPKAQSQSIKSNEDKKLSITLKATDDDNDTIGYRVSNKPKHGKLDGKAPNITYIPNKDYNGKDSFTFIANDGQADSNEAIINIDIAPVADMIGLKLKIKDKEINKDTNTSYTIEPVYDEGPISKELKEKAKQYTITSNINGSIKTDKHTNTITPIKDGNLTIQAKIDNISSNPVTLNVYWEVNGHRLPPEPDPKINNSTLLGIDSNNNGVRDDVERWIYEEYGKMHPVNVAVAMEAAKVYQEIIKNPENAKELDKQMHKHIMCESYLMYSSSPKIKNIFPKEINDEYFEKSIVINTDLRKKEYEIYNYLLGGTITSTGTTEEEKNACLQIPSIKKALEGVLK